MLTTLRESTAEQVIWDKDEKASVKGLHLRTGANGAKSFYLFYRTRAGQQRRPKIGVFGEITLTEARKRARLLLDRVAIGEDPKGGWDIKKAELTVGELFERTWEEHWDKPRYNLSGWSKQVKWCYDKHIGPTFGSLKLSELNPAKVRNWHAGFKDVSIYSGNHSIKILSRMFRFAEEQELRSQHTNPCRLVKSFPEKKRKRYASQEEIVKIAALLEGKAKQQPAAVAFLYLLMFTGSRPRAIERAEWDQLKEFDMDGKKFGLLTFRGKSSESTGNDETVILPPQAMRVISWLPRIEGCTITGIQMPRRLWRSIKKEAGCNDLWARDWRRTFATIGMSNVGVSTDVIGELLNHHTRETTKVYAKLMDNKRVEAAASIAQKIQNISQGLQEKAE